MTVVEVIFDHLNDVPEACRKGTLAGLVKHARKVETSAKQNCPVRTGALLSSIHVEVVDEAHPDVRVVAGDAVANYAVPVEFGTVHMAPRLFMTRANKEHASDFGVLVASEVDKAMKALGH